MKRKIKIKELTGGSSYSLQDASEATGFPKNEIYDEAKAIGMTLGLLFGRYTVFTKAQVDELGATLTSRRSHGRQAAL
jgi:hypothetical protein